VNRKPQIEYIYLPIAKGNLKNKIIRDFPGIIKEAHKIPGGSDDLIGRLYSGQKENIDRIQFNLSSLTKFSGRVLKVVCKIPRGKVDTYSGLAAKAGSPRASRAVGTVMANNPLPIVIPCHRVVRADGTLGGYGGGVKMKMDLLKKEGVVLEKNGKVSRECFW
jgi:methylated-DNA-[protein]-cysteine S-methyltransferase